MTVKIDGTNTVANPAFTGADTDTGLQCGTNELNLVTGGTARLHIDSSGKIGVGTSSPKEVVDARGAAVFSGDHATSQNAYGTAHGIMLSSTSNLASIKAVSNGSNDVAIRFIPLSSGSGSEAMRIDSSGRIGIGTSSPGAALHIESSSADAAKLRIGFDSPRYYDIFRKSSDGTGFLNFYGSQTGYTGYVFGGVDGERMRIDSSGRLLINNSSSTNGKVVIEDTSFQVSLETGTSGHGRLQIGHFAAGAFIGTYGDDGGGADVIRFGTHSGDERVRIQSAGGISFNGDTAQTNALNDYEEGTHTIVTNTNLTPRSDYSVWRYTKIGNQVTVAGLLYVSSVSSTNFVTVSLPFPAAASVTNGVNSYTGQPMFNFVDTGDAGLAWYIGSGSSNMAFYTLNDNGSWGQLRNSSLASADELYCTVTYFTDY